MCRVLRASGRRHPPRRGAGSRQKSLLLAGAEHRLCVQESTGLQGSSAASTTLGQPLKTGSGRPSLYRGGEAPAGCCSPDHGSRALTIPGGAGCRGHRHLLPPHPLLSRGTGGFALRHSLPGSAPAPVRAPRGSLPRAHLARTGGRTHRRRSAPSARAQERCWLCRGPVQQQAGGQGRGGLPAPGMAAVPPPALLSAPGETGLPEGGSSLIQ